MSSTKKLILSALILLCLVANGACFEESSVESRGKKKKIALFVYFADLVIKKFFIVKLIYAFVFWVVLHKAGYFLAWFSSYLKEQKQEHHEFHPHHDFHPHHYEYHDHDHSYGPYRKQGGSF